MGAAGSSWLVLHKQFRRLQAANSAVVLIPIVQLSIVKKS